uniref:(northern house mosquito) hypothetical protein n=1 Tax=Culex pipiens TaxID=7175 RepID=A0A8D8IFK4_CULPI
MRSTKNLGSIQELSRNNPPGRRLWPPRAVTRNRGPVIDESSVPCWERYRNLPKKSLNSSPRRRRKLRLRKNWKSSKKSSGKTCARRSSACLLTGSGNSWKFVPSRRK